jgi:hypothetical protein
VLTAHQLREAHDVNVWEQMLAKLDAASIERIKLADAKRLFGDTVPRNFVTGVVNGYTCNYCAMTALFRSNCVSFRGYTFGDIATREHWQWYDWIVDSVTAFSVLLVHALHYSV